MLSTLLLISLAVVGNYAIQDDSNTPAARQLQDFKEGTLGPIGELTTSAGAPVSRQQIGPELLLNEIFLELILHVNREIIPERIVHAKGTGAFGYFEVTRDITDICKADLFSQVGTQTPVAVRFSPAFTERGGADTNREMRGFSIKFYTLEGNFDLLMLNVEMFAFKNPVLFRSAVHINKRNPKTNVLNDANMRWDFVTQRPETAFQIMTVFADQGVPDGYRHMPGFAIHVFEVINDNGDPTYIKFHMLPDLGIKNIYSDNATRLAGEDPDYFTKDLYNAIANGDFPTWTLFIQVMTAADVEAANIDDVFDVTKVWSQKLYPLEEVGKLVLNKNPENHFAQVEQIAFSPANLVPGILGGLDILFKARRLAYRDAQNYRLGVNFNNIDVNCPFLVATYNRDGKAPVKFNGGEGPNYFPNSFHGPVPSSDAQPRLTTVLTNPNATNFGQAADLYRSFQADEQQRLADNIVNNLINAAEFIQERTVRLFSMIDQNLGNRIALGLQMASK